MLLLLLLHQRLRQLGTPDPMHDGSVRAGHTPARPYLKPWYRVAKGGDSTLFHFGRSMVAIREPGAGGLLRRLLPLLDGTRDLDHIAMEFPPDQRDSVFLSLGLMNSRQLLLDGPIEMSSSEGAGQTAEFLGAALGRPVHPNRVASAVARSIVGVIGSARAATVAVDLLSKAGSHARSLGSDGWQPRALADLTLLIAAPTAGEVERLAGVNRTCLDARVPWLQVLPFDGDCAIVGPIFVPWQTCCFECFQRRRNSNSTLARFLRSFDGRSATSPTAEPVEHLLAAFASLVALRWLLSTEIETPGRAYCVQFSSQVSFEAHTIYRVPRCAACTTQFPAPAVRTIIPSGHARLESGSGVQS